MDIKRLAGTRLGNYEIHRLLGEGGMGVVYKARQVSLNRIVALKILSSSLSSDPSFVKRFRREARAVAQLNHQNIVQVYDIGEEKGIHFFSMEYVRGQTLEKTLKEGGYLSASEAVKVVSQVARAMEHAHRHGVIHRDIKPSNIMLDSLGRAKIMDFGLARMTVGITKLTKSGILLGTLGYMSPEQCKGEELDERSDIYSLGVVLYEALTGRLPFDAPDAVALIHKVTHENPVDLRSINPDVPLGLSRVVGKSMARDKEKRYRSCSEFNYALLNSKSLEIDDAAPFRKSVRTRPIDVRKRPLRKPARTKPTGVGKRPLSRRNKSTVAAIIIMALACAGLAAMLLARQPEPARQSEKPVAEKKVLPSIAVLPFVDLSPEKNLGYLCDGFPGELIDALAEIEELEVVDQESSFALKGENVATRDIGRMLGVDSVLEGGIRKEEDVVEISAQLISVDDGANLWSGRFNRFTQDIPQIHIEVMLALADTLLYKDSPGKAAYIKADVKDDEYAISAGRNEAMKHRHMVLNALRNTGAVGTYGPDMDRFKEGKCEANLMNLSRYIKTFATKNRQTFPRIDEVRGNFIFDGSLLYPKYMSDVSVLGCLADSGFRNNVTFRLSDNREHPDSNIGDVHPDCITCESYVYLGWLLMSEQEGLAAIDAYLKASPDDLEHDLIVPDGKGNEGSNRIKRLKFGIERYIVSDINIMALNDESRPAATIPVMWEWPTNHGDGGHVLYFDDHVEFVPYPGKFPMSEKFIWALRQIRPQLSRDVPPIITK